MAGDKRCPECGVPKREEAYRWVRYRSDGSKLRARICHHCEKMRRRKRAGVGEPRALLGPPVPEADLDLSGATRLLITCAQNATPVHPGFWAALNVAAKRMRATIVVVPLRYRNPTSLWSERQKSEDWWDERTLPHLCTARKRLNSNLVLAADVRTQPTAVSPLSGFDALTGAESCLVAHPKVQLRTVAAPHGRYPKLLATTGACTRQNYSDTKQGALGKFHHSLGAALVELEADGRTFHLRQILAQSDGSFTDLATEYRPEGARQAKRPAALVLGDAHVATASPIVTAATDALIAALRPAALVWHDVLDGQSVNPHDAGNPFVGYAKSRAGLLDVQTEVEGAVAAVVARTPSDATSYVVGSNHNEFLLRWLASHDWRRDPENARFYLETALDLLATARWGPGGAECADPFARAVARLSCGSIKTVSRGESLRLAGIELGLHGDAGPNGAKATLQNLARLGAKTVTGHGHSPAIEEGHCRVGTSTQRRLSYQRGPTSALNTHCLVYANGKRTLITVVNGRWRLE